MEAWLEDYHQIYVYTIDEQGLEFVHKDYSAEFSTKFEEDT